MLEMWLTELWLCHIELDVVEHDITCLGPTISISPFIFGVHPYAICISQIMLISFEFINYQCHSRVFGMLTTDYAYEWYAYRQVLLYIYLRTLTQLEAGDYNLLVC